LKVLGAIKPKDLNRIDQNRLWSPMHYPLSTCLPVGIETVPSWSTSA